MTHRFSSLALMHPQDNSWHGGHPHVPQQQSTSALQQERTGDSLTAIPEHFNAGVRHMGSLPSGLPPSESTFPAELSATSIYDRTHSEMFLGVPEYEIIDNQVNAPTSQGGFPSAISIHDEQPPGSFNSSTPQFFSPNSIRETPSFSPKKSLNQTNREDTPKSRIFYTVFSDREDLNQVNMFKEAMKDADTHFKPLCDLDYSWSDMDRKYKEVIVSLWITSFMKSLR